MRRLLALSLLAACGGSSKPATTTPPPPATSEVPSTNDVCTKALAWKTAKCGKFAELDFDDVGTCVTALEPQRTDPMFAPTAKCVMQPSCEEAQNCLAALESGSGGDGGHARSTRACNDTKSMDPVGIPAADWAKRNGADVTKFSQAVSTKDKPIEMCGIDMENEWLVSLECDDGSQPLHNGLDAEKVRGGNVGPGGKCGSIVDVYKPKCGGKEYAIYIDAYVCPLK